MKQFGPVSISILLENKSICILTKFLFYVGKVYSCFIYYVLKICSMFKGQVHKIILCLMATGTDYNTG